MKLRRQVSCHKFDFQLLYVQIPSLRTPHYYGQLPLSLGKALTSPTPLNGRLLMQTADTCFLPNQQISMESQHR